MISKIKFIEFIEEYIKLCLKYDIELYGFDDGLHIKEYDDYTLIYDIQNNILYHKEIGK